MPAGCGLARLWTTEYQDLGRASISFSLCSFPYQAILDNIKAIVPASCGLSVRGLKRKQGEAINKVMVAQRQGKALPSKREGTIKRC
jgi:hypothetical protein